MPSTFKRQDKCLLSNINILLVSKLILCSSKISIPIYEYTNKRLAFYTMNVIVSFNHTIKQTNEREELIKQLEKLSLNHVSSPQK